MAFNIGAGFSEMGAAIEKTAGTAALEAQKADLENQKITLADQLAGAREHTARAETAGYEAAAAQHLQDFTAAQNVLGRASQERIAKLQKDATLGAAGISAGASMANTRAVIAAGAIETGMDTNGRTVVINKLNGSTSFINGPDGKPLQLVNPAQAQLARDVVVATNEQIRAATQQYTTAAGNARKDVEDSLKSAGGDETDPSVVAARAREQAVINTFNTTIKSLNATVNAQVNAALHQADASAPAPQAGAKPPLSSFRLAPPSAPTNAVVPSSGLINAPSGATNIPGTL